MGRKTDSKQGATFCPRITSPVNKRVYKGKRQGNCSERVRYFVPKGAIFCPADCDILSTPKTRKPARLLRLKHFSILHKDIYKDLITATAALLTAAAYADKNRNKSERPANERRGSEILFFNGRKILTACRSDRTAGQSCCLL